MRWFFAVVLVFVMLSCKKETEASSPDSADTEEAVAVNDNGAFTVIGEEKLAKSWEARLEPGTKLGGFEVVKGLTEGDKQVEFYMLVARTNDGAEMVASLLEMRGNKFYFGMGGEESASYVLVVCKGECDSGCHPVAKNSNGSTHLICSSCADCEKNEIGVR